MPDPTPPECTFSGIFEAEFAERATRATLAELGGCAMLDDIDSLRHERVHSLACRA